MSQPPEDPSMMSPKGEQPSGESQDRPLECSECKRPIAVRYSEIMGNAVTHTYMCNECPVLQRKLGHVVSPSAKATATELSAGLCCGNCGTTLQAIQMGSLLGCATCYEVFGDVLLSEMRTSKKVAQRISKATKKPIHLGRSPGEAAKLNPSLRLVALNEALKETLSREDYEQAAWLRDQIKELTEDGNKDGGNGGKK